MLKTADELIESKGHIKVFGDSKTLLSPIMSTILTPTMKQEDHKEPSPKRPQVDNIIRTNEIKEEQSRTASKTDREKRGKKRKSSKERPKIPFLVDIKNNAKVKDSKKEKTQKSNVATPGTSTPKLTTKSHQETKKIKD